MAKNVMLSMRNIGCDYIEGAAADSDDFQKMNKKDLLAVDRKYPMRFLPPTHSQIALIRRMCHSIFSSRAPGMKGGFFTDKDLKPEWQAEWEAFYFNSYFWQYILEFNQTLTSVMDLSYLWFREFWMEFTSCVQFPIAQSLPWILTEFLINTPAAKENIFFAIEIYNDAAHGALTRLEQQHLYNEVEAECSLSFDQLIFHLSNDIFKYFKALASSVNLNKDYYRVLSQKPAVQNSRYLTLMQQRHFTLLGRPVDINKLISSHVNGYLKKNIEYVIGRFCAADLTYVVNFRYLLENVRTTHALMKDHLILDSFEDMFNEVNECSSVGQFRGRVFNHIATELTIDIAKNFSFNTSTERFVRPAVAYAEPPKRESALRGVKQHFWYGNGFRQAYEALGAQYRGYFGLEHIEALLDILKPADVPDLCVQLTTEISRPVIDTLEPYIAVVTDVLPPMPPNDRQKGTLVGFPRIQGRLVSEKVTTFSALRPELFQTLRTVGNLTVLLKMLDSAWTLRDILNFQQRAFFIGAFPKHVLQPVLEGEEKNIKPTYVLDGLRSAYENGDQKSGLVTVLTKAINLRYTESATSRETKLATDVLNVTAEVLKKEALSHKTRSIMGFAMQEIRRVLRSECKESSKGLTPRRDLLLEVANQHDFQRLLSILQFIFCMPDLDAEIPDPEAFGDGFNWGICLVCSALGITEQFEILDYSYQMLRIASDDPLPDHKPKNNKPLSSHEQLEMDLAAPIKKFLATAAEMRFLNDRIFTFLDAYMPRESTSVNVDAVDPIQKEEEKKETGKRA